VGPGGQLQPEDPGQRLSALSLLRPSSGQFVLRLYAEYTGPAGTSAAAQAEPEIVQYSAAGFQTELVLRYRPAEEDPAAAVPGFVEFVRAAVHQLGANPNLVSLQVTNEANVPGAPDAADGAYAGAENALVRGVEAAKAEIERGGYRQLRVGFNWAYQLGASETLFWRQLAELGGPAFVAALDWVGVDAYPGTWGPPLPAGDLASAVRTATVDTLDTLRNTYMPLAGIPLTVPINFCESGYPTGPGRTPEQQSTVLEAAVRTVSSERAVYGVSGYRWFDLRDANSSSTSFEDKYGLMTDAYVPKPAFAVYRALVAQL